MNRVSALAAVVVLGACSGSQSASKSNFQVAIQDYYASQMEACIDSGMRFPHELLESNYRYDQQSQLLDEFVSIGFLSSEKFEKEVVANPLAFFTEMKTVSGTRYALTPEGESVARTMPGPVGLGGASFCYGSYRVIEVTNFTEPAEFLGRQVSSASYTYEAVEIAAWAGESDILQTEYQSLARDLGSRDELLKGEATLVLTENGWIHGALFGE